MRGAPRHPALPRVAILPTHCRRDASSRRNTSKYGQAPSRRRTLDRAAQSHMVNYGASPPTDACRTSITGSTPVVASSRLPPKALVRGRRREGLGIENGPFPSPRPRGGSSVAHRRVGGRGSGLEAAVALAQAEGMRYCRCGGPQKRQGDRRSVRRSWSRDAY